ncbi:MAG TPA: hypothetical protein VHV27_05370 [Phenylobacterium sp.]|jgi:hypothetical protein|nr:hypothetical protein [Phenylobacterium sp.]
MRRFLLGVLIAAGLAGAASASDYIVVNSTDPAVKRGTPLDAGARVPLAAGRTLTVMRASGEVTTLKGGPAGVTLPGARLAASDTARFDTLRALIDPPPQGRTFGARRGGAICPPAATLDDIVKLADVPGCRAEARTALDAYIAKTGGK